MEPHKENQLPRVEINSHGSPESSINYASPEVNKDKIFENGAKQESLAEQASKIIEMSNSQPVVQSTVLPDPVVNDDAQIIVTPTTAQDNDLMEKEWVNDLKKMINETRDDPFLREQKFRKMQVDYLKKRYGRILGEGN